MKIKTLKALLMLTLVFSIPPLSSCRVFYIRSWPPERKDLALFSDEGVVGIMNHYTVFFCDTEKDMMKSGLQGLKGRVMNEAEQT